MIFVIIGRPVADGRDNSIKQALFDDAQGNDNASQKILFYKDAGVIKGFAVYTPVNYDGSMYLDYIAVDPGFSRKGASLGLMGKVFQIASSKGIDKVTLLADKDDSRLTKFYAEKVLNTFSEKILALDNLYTPNSRLLQYDYYLRPVSSSALTTSEVRVEEKSSEIKHKMVAADDTIYNKEKKSQSRIRCFRFFIFVSTLSCFTKFSRKS